MRILLNNVLEICIQGSYLFEGNCKQPLEMWNYFLICKCKPKDMVFVLYKEYELRTIHRSFVHPSVRAIESFLRRESGNNPDAETRTTLDKIAPKCETCRKSPGKPHLLKLTIGTEDLRFNHEEEME